MKKLRKILKITGFTLLGLIALAFLIPIIFKKQIVAKVKSEINNSLTAVVDFSDVDISLIRRFPRLSVRLENLSVVGTGEFEKDTLVASRHIDLALNLMSLFKDEMTVYRVDLQSPRIRALVNEDGKANWDIAKTDTSATPTDDADTSATHFKMRLDHYSIKDGYIYYNDETANMTAEISGLNHEGSGDLTADVFTLSTKTVSDAVYFSYEGIPYINNFRTTINSDIHIDNKIGKYSFQNCDLAMNDLKLNADGFFQLVDDSTYNMDITFKSPSTEFKSILSLVPGIYKQEFDKIKTEGTASFNGFVRGEYSDTKMPAYDFNLDVKDGFFQYPDLPKPVKNIRFGLKASNPDGQPDNAVVQISNGHIEMDKEGFDFSLLYKNPETVQYIDAVAKGRIDLAQIAQFVKLEEGTKLGGLVHMDAFAKGSMAAMETGSGAFNAGGFLNISELFYAAKDFPQPIQHGNMKINIVNSGGVADQTTVDISSGHIELGSDPFDFALKLSKPMTAVNFDGNVKGRLTLDHLKQFMELEPGTSVSGVINGNLAFAGSKEAIDKGDYHKLNTTGNVLMENIKYVSPDYPTGMQISVAQLVFNPQNATLSQFKANYLKSNISASGVLDNLLGYAFKNQTLQGRVLVDVDQMNLNDWMGTESTATTNSNTTTTADSASSASAPFAVPANIDLTLQAKAGKVTYDKVEYKNISGTLLLKDEAVRLENVKTEALDGTIVMNGSYSTKNDPANPDISFAYDIKNVSVQKAFNAYNTVQKLMPIGQFLDGKLSSQLNMKGKLNGEMMPDLSTLSGNGNMLLLEGVLKKFAPLEKIASTLNIANLDNVTLKDVKSHIEFANGKVLVKPFQVKLKDIDMEVGGMHGIDQTLNYIVQMKVPRSYMGSAGNQLVNNLAEKASNRGVPVKLGETVNLTLKLGGSVSNPSVQTDLKEAAGDAREELKQQAESFAQQKIDTAKQVLRDSANALKQQVTNEIKETIKDNLKDKLLGTKDTSSNAASVDSTKQKAGQTIKNTMNKLLKKKG